MHLGRVCVGEAPKGRNIIAQGFSPGCGALNNHPIRPERAEPGALVRAVPRPVSKPKKKTVHEGRFFIMLCVLLRYLTSIIFLPMDCPLLCS